MPEAFRVLVAGAGVAALEAVLALRDLAGERVAIELLAPGRAFRPRSHAIAEAFELTGPVVVELEPFAAEQELRFHRGMLSAVDVTRSLATTVGGEQLPYDALLVACGATATRSLPGATTLTVDSRGTTLRQLIADARDGRLRRLGLVVPPGTGWTLPIYELALLLDGELPVQPGTRVEIVTEEAEPVELFGPAASRAVAELLELADITVHGGRTARSFSRGVLEVEPKERIAADHVVALPRLRGPAIDGLPATADGFLPVDDRGRVPGCPGVHAAGDATAFSVKQGGLAAQQADAAACAIAQLAGAAVACEPFRPVLRGVLLTRHERRFLQAELDAEGAATSASSSLPLWWPPDKLAAHHLGRYLAGRGLGSEPPQASETLEVEVLLPTVTPARA